MIGFERGITSSFEATRGISVVAGWILNVSYMTVSQAGTGLEAIEDTANLHNREQAGHAVEVIGNKLAVTSRFNYLPSFVDFSPQFILNITIVCQLPESKSQL